jgi:fibronectin-binding autotransporter adhesin
MKTFHSSRHELVALLLAAGICLPALSSGAANIYKANNADALNLGSSWTNGAAPGATDTAIWDANVGAAANCTNVLGVSQAWSGLTILNPAAPVQINNDGNTLTLTNLSMANATVDAFLNCGLDVEGNPQWQIGPNGGTRKLTIGSAVTGGGNLKQAYGVIALAPGAGSLPATMKYAWAGSGILDLGGNSQALENLGTPWAARGTVTNGSLSLNLATGDFAPAPQGNNSIQDLSGLSAFAVNNPARNFTFNVGGSTAGNIFLYLAAQGLGTNFLAVNALNVGSGSGINSAPGPLSVLYLGQNNVINANSINLAGYKGSGSILFKGGLANPKLTIRGTDGVSALPNWTLGSVSTGVYAETATNDFTGGTIVAVVNNLLIAQHIAGANNNANGILTIDGAASSLVAANVTLVQKNSTGTPTLIGALNQLNGAVQIGTLTVGDNAGGSAIIKAAYNLSAGRLGAQVIQPGAGAVNAGGFRTVNWTGGTIANYDSVTPLTIYDGVTVSAPGAGDRHFSVDSSLVNTLQNQIVQDSATAQPIVKDGAGTLDLQGATDNAYLALNVSNGVVILDKASGSGVHAVNRLTLNGGTVQVGGSGGDQLPDTSVVTLNSGTWDENNQTETIGGLAATGGTLTDSTGFGTLTVNVAGGTNYVCAANLTDNLNLTIGGSGTQILTGTDSRSAAGTTINSGTLQIGSGGANGALAGASVTINAPGVLAFNRAGSVDYAGAIYGDGNVAQNGSGTLILSGSDSHTGATLVNTGTLAVASGAATVGGSVITVAPGATFDTTAGAGFYLNYNQILNGNGTVNGSYLVSSGATNAGNLVVNGNLTLLDASVLNPGAAFGPGTLTVNGNVTNAGNNLLIYNLATATTPGGGTNALLVVTGNLDLGNNGNAPVLIIRGTPASGTYTLATFGTFSGTPAAITVQGSARYNFTPQVVGHQLQLVVTGNAGDLTWLGDGAANAWDANNAGKLVWTNNTSHALDYFNSGDNATFNDRSANPSVNIATTVLPGAVTVNNASVNYTFAGGGNIDGPVALTKTNTGSLTLQNNNTFTGPVNLNGGVVSVASVAPAGTPQPLGEGTTLNFNGGVLQYTGPAVGIGGFNRDVTLNAGGGTIDQESSGGIAFFITNRITGAGGLTKAGAQQLILGDTATGAGSNDYSGVTYVAAGNLQIRNASALGSVAGKTVVQPGGSLSADGGFTQAIPENIDLAGGTLQGGPADYNYAGDISLVTNSLVGGSNPLTLSGPVSGAGLLEKVGGGKLTLLNNNNTYSGGLQIDAGTVQLGTNGNSGWLAAQPAGVALTNNGAIAFNRADTNTFAGDITGTGSVLQNGSGMTILAGANSFTGNVGLNNGTLRAASSAALGAPTNAVVPAGGTSAAVLELSGGIVVPNNLTLAARSPAAQYPPLLRNFSGTNTFAGTLTAAGGGLGYGIESLAGGKLILSGLITNPLSGSGGYSRPLQLFGAGDGEVTGSIEPGAANFDLIKLGTGTWRLSGVMDYTHSTMVSNGVLVVNSPLNNAAVAVGGGTLVVNASVTSTSALTVSGGGILAGAGSVNNSVSVASGSSVAPGDNGVGTLTINGDLNSAGDFAMEINKALSQSNDVVAVTGLLTNAGAGTVVVTNLNPAQPLAVGDTFKLFSQPLLNGGALTVAGGGAGVTWANNLAADGSIAVLSVTPPVNTNSFPLVAVVAGSQINLSWPPDRLGWKVQVQTNALNVGLRANWVTLADSASVTNYTININRTNPAVFIRMTYP